MKHYTVIIENDIIKNATAYFILNTLKNKSFLYQNIKMEDFIKEIQINVWKLFGISIDNNSKNNEHEKCEFLVEELINKKLIPLP